MGMDDNNMNDLLKKAQEMINNNQVPDQIKEMMQNMGSTPTSNQSSSIDPAMLSKVQKIASNFSSNSNDDMSQLLLALKPYLRDKKQNKVDDYINLLKMGKMAKLFDLMGGDSK